MNRERDIQPIVDFLRALSQTLTMAILYSPEHPRVLAHLPRVSEPLQQLPPTIAEVSIIVFNDDLLYQGKPLVREVNLIKLATLLKRAGIGHLTFRRQLDGADIRGFVRTLQSHGDLAPYRDGSGPIRVGTVTVEADEKGVEPIASYNQLTTEQLAGLQSFYDTLASGGQLDLRRLVTLVAGFIAAFRREQNPLLALTPIRNMDDYTFTHSINVGILNIAQGMSLGITAELLHDLGVAGMLHDCGKLFVDRMIVQKPGALTDEEYAAMQTHPLRGARYLLGQEGIPRLAVISAYEHHMRFDLKGYPQPPPGWSLNLCSQMTMISDTFDALRTRRIYKDPWDFPTTCSHMLTLAGSQLNEELTVNFLGLLAKMGDGLPPAQLDDAVPARQCYCE